MWNLKDTENESSKPTKPIPLDLVLFHPSTARVNLMGASISEALDLDERTYYLMKELGCVNDFRITQMHCF